VGAAVVAAVGAVGAVGAASAFVIQIFQMGLPTPAAPGAEARR